MFNFALSLIKGNNSFIITSIFILALAAVEARIGISLVTLISRKFQNSRIKTLSLLKK